MNRAKLFRITILMTMALAASGCGVFKKGKHSNTATGTDSAAGGTTASDGTGPGAVQSRNAGANICTGLPPAYAPGAQGPP